MYNCDFTQIGSAIKNERKRAGLTREQLAEQINISPRYLIAIENDGQAPSFHVFCDLIRLFNISADQYILKSPTPSSNSAIHRINCLLTQIDVSDLVIIEHTIMGILEAKNCYPKSTHKINL